MANMSYCRNQNTAKDLMDVVEHYHEDVSSQEEYNAKKRIFEMAKEIVEFGPPEKQDFEDDEEDDEK